MVKLQRKGKSKYSPGFGSGPVVVDDSGNQLMWIGLICLLDIKQPRG